jgi:transposase
MSIVDAIKRVLTGAPPPPPEGERQKLLREETHELKNAAQRANAAIDEMERRGEILARLARDGAKFYELPRREDAGNK